MFKNFNSEYFKNHDPQVTNLILCTKISQVKAQAYLTLLYKIFQKQTLDCTMESS